MRRLLLCGSLCALAIVAAGCEPETVANPDYHAWALYEPGSFVTFEGTRQIGDEAHPVRVTQTLVAKEADRLLLERTTTLLDGPDTPAEVIRTIEPATVAPADHLLTHPKAVLKDLGSETIEVAGQSFHCQIRSLEIHETFLDLVPTTQDVTAQASVSPDMPGRYVKVDMLTEAPFHRLRISGQAVDFKAIRQEED